jgi:hypothetical protein
VNRNQLGILARVFQKLLLGFARGGRKSVIDLHALGCRRNLIWVVILLLAAIVRLLLLVAAPTALSDGAADRDFLVSPVENVLA